MKKNKEIKILGALIVAGIFFSFVGNSSATSVSDTVETAAVYQAIQQSAQPAAFSNNNHYTNSIGNTVHSPAYSENNSVPIGASARCGDGTYSFSQSRRGTCSHHGGVAQWL